MSRNRNLRNKIVFPTLQSQLPIPENYTNLEKNSGQKHGNNITPCDPKANKCYSISRTYCNLFSNLCSSNDDTLRSIKSDNDNVSFNSSSSLSWEDDYEQECTQIVANEFHRMERVLQGLETIPSNYDDDEYSLWRRTFPNFSFSGNSQSNKQDGDMEYKKTEKNCVKFSESKNSNKDSRHHFPHKYKSKPLNKGHKLKHIKTNKTQDVMSIENLISQFDDILQVSPIHINEPNRNANKKLTNISKAKSSVFKDRRKIVPEFTSLPHITVDNYVSNNPQMTRVLADPEDLKLTRSIKSQKSVKHQEFILPPLNPTCSSSKEIRSFSVTPRQTRTGTSALSDVLSTRRCEMEKELQQYNRRNASVYSGHINTHTKKFIF